MPEQRRRMPGQRTAHELPKKAIPRSTRRCSPAQAGAHASKHHALDPGLRRGTAKSPKPTGGWIDREYFEPRPAKICLSVGRFVHDDDSVKVLAGSAMIVCDDERLMLSGLIETPARCVVRIVRLQERLS